MNIHVHVACWNEAEMMPWFLAHYSGFATRIFCHDNGSTDGTRELVAACPKAELVDFDTGGELRDDLLRDLKNHAWKDRGADWVVCVDVDEFLRSPTCPIPEALARFEANGVPVPTTDGYQMWAEALPDFRRGVALTDVVRRGVPDALYAKRCLFDARVILEVDYSAGCHQCRPLRRGGAGVPAEECGGGPPLQLLHFKFARGYRYLIDRSRRVNARMSAINRARGWGWQFSDEARMLDRFRQVAAEAADVPFLDPCPAPAEGGA